MYDTQSGITIGDAPSERLVFEIPKIVFEIVL
jgi:hypothetical protein